MEELILLKLAYLVMLNRCSPIFVHFEPKNRVRAQKYLFLRL